MPRTTAKKPNQTTKTRKLKPVKGKFFGLVKKEKYKLAIPTAYQIFKASNKHLWQHKKLFGLITLIYLGLTFILVRGFSLTTDLGLAKQSFQELFSGSGSALTSSLAVFGYLVGTNSPNSDVASVYQSIIVIIVSLATIWALRQTHAKESVTLQDSFFKSSYPLVQFVLVVLFIGLQLIPFVLGSFLFSSTVGTGVAQNFLAKGLWSLLSFLLALWSVYMVSASIFALYIVTLPDMTPIRALRAAKKLVQYRRWTVLRKVLFLPVMIIILMVAIMLPAILFLTPISEVVFILVTSCLVVLVHGYMYTLYRELL